MSYGLLLLELLSLFDQLHAGVEVLNRLEGLFSEPAPYYKVYISDLALSFDLFNFELSFTVLG